MRYKILAGVLVLGLAISLGFNVYCYSAMVDKQATINNMRGHIIVAWAEEMSVAGYYLKDATTNTDIQKVLRVLRAAYAIALSSRVSEKHPLYWRMCFTASHIEMYLSPYSEGSPTFVRHINPTAIEMFGNLTEEIWKFTRLIFQEEIDLTRGKGVDPIQVLQEKGVLGNIIDYTIDAENLSRQIQDFSPKFQ